MQTLEQILTEQNKVRNEDGPLGINECKHIISLYVKYGYKTLEELLVEYVNAANSNEYFNKAVVLATWELINDKTQSR